MEQTIDIAKNDAFEGLCFTNIVDFDSKWGHRRDPEGYALGEVIRYEIACTNNSEESFDYVVLHDILYDNGYGLDQIDVFHGVKPHETRTVTFDYPVDSDDVDWGYIKNKAFVTWEDGISGEEGRSYSNNVFTVTIDEKPVEELFAEFYRERNGGVEAGEKDLGLMAFAGEMTRRAAAAGEEPGEKDFRKILDFVMEQEGGRA